MNLCKEAACGFVLGRGIQLHSPEQEPVQRAVTIKLQEGDHLGAGTVVWTLGQCFATNWTLL